MTSSRHKKNGLLSLDSPFFVETSFYPLSEPASKPRKK